MVWLPFFIFPYRKGISSSQLTNSYFSEGWPNHQPVIHWNWRDQATWLTYFRCAEIGRGWLFLLVLSHWWTALYLKKTASNMVIQDGWGMLGYCMVLQMERWLCDWVDWLGVYRRIEIYLRLSTGWVSQGVRVQTPSNDTKQLNKYKCVETKTLQSCLFVFSCSHSWFSVVKHPRSRWSHQMTTFEAERNMSMSWMCSRLNCPWSCLGWIFKIAKSQH